MTSARVLEFIRNITTVLRRQEFELRYQVDPSARLLTGTMSSIRQCATAAVMESTQQHTASGSPNSSEEVESHHGTPATKLSAFSPEDFRTQSKGVTYGTVRTNLPPTFTLSHAQGKSGSSAQLGNHSAFSSQDPFVTISGCASTSQGSNDPPKLSPVASSFTPFKFQKHSSVNLMMQSLKLSPPKSDGQAGVMGLGHVATSSVPSTTSARYSIPVGSELPMPSTSQPVSSVSSSDHANVEPGSTKIGQFSSDGETSRSLVISQIPKATSKNDVDDFFSVCHIRSL